MGRASSSLGILFSTMLIGIMGVGFPAQASSVSSSINLEGNPEYDNVLARCGTAYYLGPYLHDSYTNVSINTGPEIDAPTNWLTIVVSFDQDCNGFPSKYTRTLELLTPSGEAVPLRLDTNQSRFLQRRYSIYCASYTNCYFHTDVYQLRLGSLSLSGDYGLRFTTRFKETVCNTVDGVSVCERDVEMTKTFDLRKLFSLKQTGSIAPWEGSVAQDVVKPSIQQLDKVTLAPFPKGSSVLTRGLEGAIEGMLLVNRSSEEAVCTGYHLKGATKSQKSLTLARAKSVCQYAQLMSPHIRVSAELKSHSNRSLNGRVLFTVRG